MGAGVLIATGISLTAPSVMVLERRGQVIAVELGPTGSDQDAVYGVPIWPVRLLLGPNLGVIWGMLAYTVQKARLCSVRPAEGTGTGERPAALQ